MFTQISVTGPQWVNGSTNPLLKLIIINMSVANSSLQWHLVNWTSQGYNWLIYHLRFFTWLLGYNYTDKRHENITLHTWRLWDAHMLMIWVIIGSGNGLAPIWGQAITWTNAELSLIDHIWCNHSAFRIKIQTFSKKEVLLRVAFFKIQQICPETNELTKVNFNSLFETKLFSSHWLKISQVPQVNPPTSPSRRESLIL